VTYRERHRLDDIQAAIDAIRSHLQRGDLSDGLIFDAVRIRLLEIGEAVKALPKELLDTQPAIPWRQITRMRDHLAHRYFDTAHGILQATVDDDLPELERAVRAMAETLPEEDQPGQDTSSEGTPSEEELPS
jgi:uncharacterized protein with HEPN domain